jgi:hypothetical protein
MKSHQQTKRWSSTDRDLPLHMRSLQPCMCLKMRGMDDAKYPDPKCKICNGTGSYIPNG